MQSALAKRAIDFELFYGQEQPGSVPRSISINDPWAHQINNHYLAFGRTQLTWQPCVRKLVNSDLVIVEQANSLLTNYILLGARRFFGKPCKFAYWGHGRNFQAHSPTSLSERLKQMLIKSPDWWFAYTNISSDIVTSSGFPTERVTTLNNTISTEAMQQALQACSTSERQQIMQRLQLTPQYTGIFCGGLSTVKQIQFLIEACVSIKKKIPQFSMLVIGDGPLKQKVIDAANQYPWFHYLGELFGTATAPYYSVADCVLMPGRVGLVIVDAFVSESPLITTENTQHSPEIAYLDHRSNGLISANSLGAYVETVAKYFADRDMQSQMKTSCRHSSRKLSLENMLANYVNGIEQCLGTDAYLREQAP